MANKDLLIDYYEEMYMTHLIILVDCLSAVAKGGDYNCALIMKGHKTFS